MGNYSDSNAMHFYNILTVGQFSRKLSHLILDWEGREREKGREGKGKRKGKGRDALHTLGREGGDALNGT